MKQTEFLDPKKRLVDEVVAKLCCDGHVRVENGAHSLAHVLVVVPTMQAGRNLRLSLARRAVELGWGGVLPPRVVLPFHLVVPADRTLPDASAAELAALFMRFLQEKKGDALNAWPHLFQREGTTSELQAILDSDAGFALLDQMTDIWHVLAGRGLLMRDVPANENARHVLEAASGDDMVRWEELASFETEFFAFLNAHGLRHPTESVALAKHNAAALDHEIEEIVLPALADPVLVLHDVLAQYADRVKITTFLHCAESERDRFDEWGCPKTGCWTGNSRPVIAALADDAISSLPDDKLLAERLVKDFPSPGSSLNLPALGLCDPELFTSISAAFLNAGYTVQNPERNRLAVSSLGLLIRDLLQLWRPTGNGIPWSAFSSLLRCEDVLAALKASEFAVSRSLVLHGLDVYQNTCLPTYVQARLEFPPEVELRGKEADAVAAFVAGGNSLLEWAATARSDRPLVEFLRGMLERVFSARSLGTARAEKEFSQAADCVRDVLAMLSSERIVALNLPDASSVALARRLFAAASYSLEAEGRDVVRTEGWLELAWSLGDKVALAGLHEGAVPDSVVGHAFIPNELRAALGLTSNAARLARDSWLLQELVDSHAPSDVRVYVSRTNRRGDICRPSRLLFLCDDSSLVPRVRGLFSETGEAALTPGRQVSRSWQLRLPDEVSLKRNNDGREYLSPSAIDTYLKSPLEYLLKWGLDIGDRYKEKKELDFSDYGKFVHRVLELFAQEQKERVQLDERDIEAALDRIVSREVGRFGPHATVNIQLQLQSARERLKRFAAIQAKWAQDGWRVEETEFRFFARPFEELDVWIKGTVDRIDSRVLADGSKEFRIVDYKTWDDVRQISGHIKSGAEKEMRFANNLKLPTASFGKDGKGKPVRMMTVQLPLYGACLSAQDHERFYGRISSYDYLVLAEDQAKVESVGQYVGLSLQTARVAIERIKANLFWPPRASEEGRLYDLGRLFSVSPECDFTSECGISEWFVKQQTKLEELKNA